MPIPVTFPAPDYTSKFMHGLYTLLSSPHKVADGVLLPRQRNDYGSMHYAFIQLYCRRDLEIIHEGTRAYIIVLRSILKNPAGKNFNVPKIVQVFGSSAASLHQ